MKLKKTLCLLLAVLLTAVSFSACGKKGSKKTSKDKSDNSAWSDTDEVDSEDGEIDTNSSSNSSGNKSNTSASNSDSGNKNNSSSNGNTGGDKDSFSNGSKVISNNKKLIIDTSKTVNSYWNGVGGNYLTYSLMPNNVADGFNEAYYEMDAKRIIQMGCSFVRIWMQVDWLEERKGEYNFDTPEMKAIFTYMKTFKEAGTDVQISYNWRGPVDKPEFSSWFNIPGLSDPSASAPADLEAFAKSCSALLQEMWRRGYDNVKYLTFGNEPDYSDFECYGDQMVYYMKMVKAVDKQLREDGIRNKVELWAGETTAESQVNWLPDMAKSIDDIVDAYSFHTYTTVSDEIGGKVQTVKEASKNKRDVYITEYNEMQLIAKNVSRYKGGYGGIIINSANSGGQGVLNWCLNGMYCMSITGRHSWTLDSEYDFWHSQLCYGEDRSDFFKNGIANRPYYLFSMVSRYIDKGSKVVKTAIEGGDDLRAATFVSKNGDITVMVECDDSQEARTLTFDFGKKLNKKFYKHIWSENTQCDQNAIIPRSVASFDCKNNFKDSSVDKNHSIVIYTTKKSVMQVEMSDPRAIVNLGETKQLSAKVLDGTSNIKWSVVSGNGTVDQNGVFKPSANASNGDIVAVKAETDDKKVYGISLIHIGAYSHDNKHNR